MDRLAFWIYRLLGASARLLPMTAVFRLGEALGALGYLVGVPYRRLVMRNLEIAFGGEKSVAERRALARDHFRLLGANLLCSLKIPTLPRAKIEKLVTVEGIETMDAGIIENGGFVMIISHIGNWELFAQLTPIIFKCPVGTIYQRLGNPHIDAMVRADRARLGLSLFERKEGFTGAMKFIRGGGAVGVLIDQHAGDAGLWCPFFGRLASTSTLAATLALRTGAWLVQAAVYTESPGRWRVSILPPVAPNGEDTETLTARINTLLELQIRRRPADWFWVHNRWKTPRPKFLLATYKRGIVAGPVMERVAREIAWAPDILGVSRSALDPRRLQPFRIVVRSSNWLGDAVMSVPAVRAIKRGRPDAHLTILTPAKLVDIWKTVAEVDAVLPIAPDERIFSVARKLRAGDFEAAIIFPNSLRSALEPWLAGIPRRVGYPGHRRAFLLNQVLREKRRKKPQPRPPEHQVHYYLRLAEFVGAQIAGEAERGERLGSADCADAPPSALHSPRTVLRLALCPGAEYGPAKRWLPERFAESIRRISAARDCEWLLVGVAKDAPVGEEILRGVAGQVRNLIGKTTLAELVAELRQCDLLLTNDTGTMHLAALLGVPTVAIFGSTEPALTGPLGVQHTVLRYHVPCSPCFLRECPIDFRCMRGVEVEEVVQAVERALSRIARARPLS